MKTKRPLHLLILLGLALALTKARANNLDLEQYSREAAELTQIMQKACTQSNPNKLLDGMRSMPPVFNFSNDGIRVRCLKEMTFENCFGFKLESPVGVKNLTESLIQKDCASKALVATEDISVVRCHFNRIETKGEKVHILSSCSFQLQSLKELQSVRNMAALLAQEKKQMANYLDCKEKVQRLGGQLYKSEDYMLEREVNGAVEYFRSNNHVVPKNKNDVLDANGYVKAQFKTEFYSFDASSASLKKGLEFCNKRLKSGG